MTDSISFIYLWRGCVAISFETNGAWQFVGENFQAIAFLCYCITLIENFFERKAARVATCCLCMRFTWLDIQLNKQTMQINSGNASVNGVCKGGIKQSCNIPFQTVFTAVFLEWLRWLANLGCYKCNYFVYPMHWSNGMQECWHVATRLW